MLNFLWFSHYEGTPEPILREVFEGWDTGNGIFSVLGQLTDLPMPWAEATFVDSTVLDIEYFGNHSGGKFCSPLVKHLLGDEDVLTSRDRVTIAKILATKYLNNWNKLWATNVVSYNPIHNYDMNEERDTVKTEDNSEQTVGTVGRTGTVTDAHGKTETVQHGRGSRETDYQYGMNNTVPLTKASDDTVIQENGSTVTTNGGNDTQTRQLTDSTNATVSEDNSSEEHVEIHRYGNVGVTTSQKMLEDERVLWAWNFFEQVFKDIDNELGLSYQDPCRV